MSIMDNKNGGREEPGGFDPFREAETDKVSLVEAARKARAQANPAHEGASDDTIENEGVPSVNRRKGGSKIITVLGFLFILGAAAALIVASNSGSKTPKEKLVRDDPANKMPPLVIPEPPPPIQVVSEPPVMQQGQPAPIALRNTPQQHNGKPVLDWTDRKMGGLLVASSETRSQGIVSAAAGPQGDNEAGDGPEEKSDLAARLQATVTKTASASMLPNRDYLITKGTALDCALETALNSTVPGITTCRLTRDVYSDNGRVLLLDRGSQLVGEYQGGLKQGQARIFVLWTRAKTPKGVVVSLNSPGTDALGRSGLEGWVDNHFIQRFGAAILLSLINETLPAVINSNNNDSGGTTNIYGSATSGGEKIIEKILESTVNIPPTIIKNQGDHIQVMAARDLDFSPVYELRAKK